jgi:hypothetical protein
MSRARITQRLCRLALAAAVVGGLGYVSHASAANKRDTVYMTVAEAGPDYKVQGEYVGMIGSAKLGCEVVADGDGNFHAVFLPGGLPGEGSDNKDRHVVKGKTDGDKTVFGKEGSDYSGTVSNGVLTGKNDKGETFELKKVDPKSPTEGAKPPAGAVVLFDGANADAWTPDNKKLPQVDSRHLLLCGETSKQKFGDYTLHVEFLEPFKPFAHGQERGNSGVYQQGHYEVQVLDSFGNVGDMGDAASVYGVKPASVNVAYPPLVWQTYDIDFTAARYGPDQKKKSDAHVTIKWNGITVQDNTDIPHATGGGGRENPREQVQTGPIYLQLHHNMVYFRNIWIVPKEPNAQP